MAPALALLSPLCRLGPALLLLPTARTLRGRALWALGAALLLAPLLQGGAGPSPGAAELSAWLLRELMVGAALGLWAAVPLLAASGAGRLLAPLVLADDRGAARPLAGLTLLLAAAVYFSSGGPRLLLRALAESYRLFPVAATATPPPELAALLLQVLAQIPLAALLLAAPLWAALLLAELALALARRLLSLAPAPPLRPLLLLLALLATAPALLAAAANLLAAYQPAADPLLRRP